MSEPPVFEGAVHERLICVPDVETALRPVGAPGAVLVFVFCIDDADGVADASGEGLLEPTELIAETRYT